MKRSNKKLKIKFQYKKRGILEERNIQREITYTIKQNIREII